MQVDQNSMRGQFFLVIYSAALTFVLVIMLLTAFGNRDKAERFDEITVKRINVIGEDGSLRMVLSNEKRQHPGRMNGKDFPPRERQAGIIYFNTNGDECGGLVFGNISRDSVAISTMSFTMDQYNQDQVIQLLNSERIENGKPIIEKGLIINEYPVGSSLWEMIRQVDEFKKLPDEKERNEKIQRYLTQNGSKNRMFLGRSKDNSTGMFLKGPDGKPRMKIYISAGGDPVIEVLNKAGELINILNDE